MNAIAARVWKNNWSIPGVDESVNGEEGMRKEENAAIR